MVFLRGLVCALLCCVGANLADAEGRVALVIGNSTYSAVPRLENPANDARDLSAALRRIGFDVNEVLDLDYRGMRLALRDFSERAETAEIAIVYFAGHGIEIDNTNYLIPINAELRRDRDVEFEAIRLGAVLDSLEGSGALKIVLVDACRNNPFVANMNRKSATRSIGRGLARVEPSGVLVGYSAKGGTLALDGAGRNSPYAKALLAHLEKPGLELGKMFRLVRDTVFGETDGVQEPFVYGSLPGRDIFLVAPEPVETVAAIQPAQSSEPVVQSRILDEFLKSEAANNIWRWNRFLEDFEDHADHRLVQLAARKRTELQRELDLKRGFSRRSPWLSDAVSPDGSITLTLEQRKLLQRSLNMMGFDTGGVDGQFGPKTRAAISQARLLANLYGANEVDRALLAVLPNVHAVEGLMSQDASFYDPAELPEDLEPRLRKALETFSGFRLRFGYFRGHLYLAVHAKYLRWSQINKMAREAGGHLATIGGAEENRFLLELFSVDERFIHNEGGYIYGPTIGLYQPDRSREPRGGWVWVTGEPVTYTRWSPGNPDNHQGRQHYSRFFLNPRKISGRLPTHWDDSSDGTWETGFLVEIE